MIVQRLLWVIRDRDESASRPAVSAMPPKAKADCQQGAASIAFASLENR
jgi:hypothetical protein